MSAFKQTAGSGLWCDVLFSIFIIGSCYADEPDKTRGNFLPLGVPKLHQSQLLGLRPVAFDLLVESRLDVTESVDLLNDPLNSETSNKSVILECVEPPIADGHLHADTGEMAINELPMKLSKHIPMGASRSGGGSTLGDPNTEQHSRNSSDIGENCNHKGFLKVRHLVIALIGMWLGWLTVWIVLSFWPSPRTPKFLLENVKGHATRGSEPAGSPEEVELPQKIDQTDSSGSHVPACSPSSD